MTATFIAILDGLFRSLHLNIKVALGNQLPQILVVEPNNLLYISIPKMVSVSKFISVEAF